MVEAYPLQWPPGWPRETKRNRARFGEWPIHKATVELKEEVRLLGGRNLVLSSNLILNNDGSPRSNQRQPEDPGVAVYFTLNGTQKCWPCDRWDRVEHNIRAIALSIGAIRGLDRWGSKSAVDAAFSGFRALPESTVPATTWRPWFKVLQMEPEEGLGAAEKKYRQLAALHHPDMGGDQAAMADLNRAVREAREFFKK